MPSIERAIERAIIPSDSKDPVIDAEFDPPIEEKVPRDLSMLRTHVASMVALDIGLSMADYTSWRGRLLFSAIFPKLKSLSLQLLPIITPASQQGDLHFVYTKLSFPALTDLALDGFILVAGYASEANSLVTIRRLSLSNYLLARPETTLHQFLRMLDGATSLTTLKLDNYLAHTIADLPRPAPLRLPALKRLFLRDTPHRVSVFGTHFPTYPPYTKIIGLWGSAKLDVIPPFQPLVSNFPATTFCQGAFTAARLDASDSALRLELASSEPPTRFVLEAEMTPARPSTRTTSPAPGDTAASALHSAAALLTRCPAIAEFVFAGAPLAAAGAHAWGAVLSATPALRVLTVVDRTDGGGAARAALWALARGTLAGAQAGGAQAQALCPRLEELVLHGARYSSSLMEDVERDVLARAERGARIGRLRLSLHPDVVDIPGGGVVLVKATATEWPERLRACVEELEMSDIVERP